MYRVFLPSPVEEGDEAELDPDDAHHVGRVLRLRKGDSLWVSDGAGREAPARIVALTKGSARVQVGRWQAGAAEPLLEVVLVQGIPKADRMDWLVQKATEVGVARIVPAICARGVVRPDPQGGAHRQQRWQRIAREAARQSQRARVPLVDTPKDLALILDEMRAIRASRPAPPAGFIPWEKERAVPLVARLQAKSPPPGAQVWLFIGPEGGWEDAEVAAMQEAGAETVSLGPRILRSETAGLIALALVMGVWGDLNERGGSPR